MSVLQHPALAGAAEMSDEAKKTETSRLVNEVWQSCWSDTRPFDEVSDGIDGNVGGTGQTDTLAIHRSTESHT